MAERSMDAITKAIKIAGRGGRRTSSRTRHAREPERHITYEQTKVIQVDGELLRENRVISGRDDRLLVDAYKLLRTRLMSRMQQNNWKTLGITSTNENEGKTLTAVNLAISIAMKLNYTVMLVDADLRRPSAHTLFGLDPAHGLSDHLESGVPIDKVLINPGIDRFVILPGGDPVGDSSELLASPRMVQLVQELKTRYPSRIIVFDLPPVLVGDDVAAFSPCLDAAMLVVEDGRTQADQLARAMEILEGVNLVGTVLNKATDSSQDGGYYYY
ncbi:MAG: CpsD/CapB family tyrosine-protein kinase [Gammaproteobacteria bacterium]